MEIKKYLQSFTSKSKPLTLQIVGPFFDQSKDLNEPVLFVDGGVQFRKNNVGFSVGDGDSTSMDLDQKLDPKKDFSDLAFVLENISEPFNKIELLGFLGHRQDHQLMNWAEVHRFLHSKTRIPTVVSFDKKIKAVSRGSWKLNLLGLFSLFSFEKNEITLTGACDYPIRKGTQFKALSSMGLSNVGHGEIVLNVTDPVFIFTESSALPSEL